MIKRLTESCEKNSDCYSTQVCNVDICRRITAPECGNGKIELEEECEQDSDCPDLMDSGPPQIIKGKCDMGNGSDNLCACNALEGDIGLINYSPDESLVRANFF